MNYKKIISLMLLIVFCSTIVKAQQTDRVLLENSLLWKISGNELTEDSYLFGTIHIIPEKDFFFTESMEKAFGASKKLLMEVNLDVAFAEQLSLVQKMMLPDGKSLESYMTNKEYSKLQLYFNDSLELSSMSIMLINKIKPLLSYSIILEEKIKNVKVFEMYFMKRAKKQNMELVGLETMEEQMSLIDNIPIESQVKMLLSMTDSKNIVEEYYEMVKVYKEQQINKLYDYAKEDRELEKYTDKLLVNRNRKWINKLSKLMKESACFIAVGSGHLAGEAGLINLLQNVGYTVIPVKVFE